MKKKGIIIVGVGISEKSIRNNSHKVLFILLDERKVEVRSAVRLSHRYRIPAKHTLTRPKPLPSLDYGMLICRYVAVLAASISETQL